MEGVMVVAETQQTEKEKRVRVSGTRRTDEHRLSLYEMKTTVTGGSFTLHCF
ncbi:hypothetical protein EXN66_Car006616 [Channa argus]|uniref:Uncharacterized protein n=1 Tax=Channa argus TaxID=215402 RepID=A0A6G1PL10_CHAAH|nr:hypothetical protein EXN66_Car006616 [Channa argus]